MSLERRPLSQDDRRDLLRFYVRQRQWLMRQSGWYDEERRAVEATITILSRGMTASELALLAATPETSCLTG